jgi:hypothetical protein
MEERREEREEIKAERLYLRREGVLQLVLL